MSDDVIPEKFADLFDKKVFANLATLMPDGRPQVTPVWCEFDGTHILINSARGHARRIVICGGIREFLFR